MKIRRRSCDQLIALSDVRIMRAKWWEKKRPFGIFSLASVVVRMRGGKSSNARLFV